MIGLGDCHSFKKKKKIICVINNKTLIGKIYSWVKHFYTLYERYKKTSLLLYFLNKLPSNYLRHSPLGNRK